MISNDIPFFWSRSWRSVGPKTIPGGKVPPFGRFPRSLRRIRPHWIRMIGVVKYPISGPITLVTISVSGLTFLFEAISRLLKPRPMNHILKVALLTSSSVGPDFLNPPRLKNDGNFRRSDLPKEVWPRRPMQIPNIVMHRIPNKDLVPILTPKWAGFTDDQNALLCSMFSGLSLAPGRPSGFSVNTESVLRTTIESAEGSFTDHSPIFFWCSMMAPFEGGGPGICRTRTKMASKKRYGWNVKNRTRYYYSRALHACRKQLNIINHLSVCIIFSQEFRSSICGFGWESSYNWTCFQQSSYLN